VLLLQIRERCCLKYLKAKDLFGITGRGISGFGINLQANLKLLSLFLIIKIVVKSFI